MRKTRTAWVAVIGLLAVGAASPALAGGSKSKPLTVTYYYLPE